MGGAKSALWRQIVSDALGIPVSLPKETDASYGAALIAGVGVGVFRTEIEAAEASVSVLERHEPNPQVTSLYDDLYQVYRESAAALVPVNHRLSAIVGEG